MPASLHIDAYPLHLYTLVESVLLTQQEVKISAEDRDRANKIRKQVYGLRNALLHSEEHPLKEKAAKLTTEQKDNILYLRHIDASVDPAVIQAARILEGD